MNDTEPRAEDTDGGPPGGAVFVVAGPSTPQQGPIAALVSTSGWARAAERVLGRSWLVTPHGVTDPLTAARQGSSADLAPPRSARLRRIAPDPAKTLVKDMRQVIAARRFTVTTDPSWSRTPPRFVWQRHELFQTAGLRLARRLGVPSVLFVPAVVVWEAHQWGTQRPGWGRLVERLGEHPALLGADLLACGSDQVAAQVIERGVDPARVIVTPSGVDMGDFQRPVDRDAIRRRLGIADRFVIGWVGSFRPFHALERAVEAATSVENSCLLLVGDGPTRHRVEALAAERGVPVTVTGTVPHDEIADLIWAMDAAVVLARPDQPFHYSPLKVAEYLACGVPVVAPATGQLAERLRHEEDSLLVPSGDDRALGQALRRLSEDPALAASLRAGALAAAPLRWSWDAQVRRVDSHLAALLDAGLAPSATSARGAAPTLGRARGPHRGHRRRGGWVRRSPRP